VSTNLPNNGALTLTHRISSKDTAKVLVMGVAEVEEVILRFVEAGAAGYILREESADALIENIWAVYNDEALISPEISAAIMSRLTLTELAEAKSAVDVGSGGYADLTPREREVLSLISQGLNNQEISENLVIEVGTVKNHVHNILQKLDVNSRYDAADYWDAMQSNFEPM
jgi:DNA-binding NarL/FixJ family response regulator